MDQMDIKKERYYSFNDIIELVKMFGRYLLRNWIILLLSLFLGIAIGIGYYFNQKPNYKAVTTFILEEKSSSSGLAGIASQFGFNLNNLNSGGSFFSGDNILEILRSKKVVEKVLLDTIGGNLNKGNKTLVDYYLQYTHLNKRLSKISALSGMDFSKTRGQLDPLYDSVLNDVYNSFIKKSLVVERLAKQGTIIRVQVTAADALFARLMSERIVDEASRLYLDLRTRTALTNINELQHRSDSLLFLLNSKSYTAAASQPLDANPGIKTASVPLEIASRDKTVLATLYAEITKNLEASKLLLSQQTPVIQQLDKPSLLLDDNKKSVAFLSIVSGLVFVLLVIAGLFLKFCFLLQAKDKN